MSFELFNVFFSGEEINFNLFALIFKTFLLCDKFWKLWTAKKSNFDTFQKVISYSLPVVGLCMTGYNLKYFCTILLPLLDGIFPWPQFWKDGHFLKTFFLKEQIFFQTVCRKT